MEEIVEFELIDYVALFITPLFFIMNNSSLISNDLIVRHIIHTGGNGIVLTSWAKYGYILIMNIMLYCMFDYTLDRIKNMSKDLLTKRMILKKLILSPFFVMFIIVFIYWTFLYNYYSNIYLLIVVLIPYCYAEYRFLKKIEKLLMK